jgi:hypothetical protein
MSVALRCKNRVWTSAIVLGLTEAALAAPTRIIYVRPHPQTPVGGGDGSSWESAFETLQEAIAATDDVPNTDEEIWVARGVYKPVTCNDNCVCPDPTTGKGTCTSTSYERGPSFFLKSTVKIYGGFVGTELALCDRPPDPDPYTIDPTTDSVLSGDLNGDDGPNFTGMAENTRFGVVYASGTDFSAVLDGFSITSGNASGSSGGGIVIVGYGSSDPTRVTIRNCTIKGNFAGYYGGGVKAMYSDYTEIWNQGVEPRFINCVITGNRSQGGGGGLDIEGAGDKFLIVNSQIVANEGLQGAGIYIDADAGFTHGKTPKIVNTLIARNSLLSPDPTQGAGIWAAGPMTLSLVNSTIVGNDASSGCGGGMAVAHPAAVNVNNTLFWGNTATDTVINPGRQIMNGNGTVTVRYSDVQHWNQCVDGTNAGGLCTTLGPGSECPGGTCRQLDVFNQPGGSQVSFVAGNLGLDPSHNPLFVNAAGPTNYNYSLQGSSPCIDAADSGAVPTDDTDVDQNGSTQEPTPIDLARHDRFANDSRSDTGAPTGCAFVDMGAYEHVPSGALAAPLAESGGVNKSRYLSFVPGTPDPTNPNRETALAVRMTCLHHPNPANGACCPPVNLTDFEGRVRWVGPVSDCYESCCTGATYKCAHLQCSPCFQNWSGVGLLNVSGADVVPSSRYSIRHVDKDVYDSCGGAIAGSIGDLVVVTARWGDVTVPYNPPDSSAQPNGLDITEVVNKFKAVVGSAKRVQTYLEHRWGDLTIGTNAIDITSCVDAFLGKAYPYSDFPQCSP